MKPFDCVGCSVPDPIRKPGMPAHVLWTVLVIAVFANAVSLFSSQLWVYPDSIDYIRLAGGIADRLDLTNELFLVRTPGYPLFLAAIFRIFGDGSPCAILIMQHVMAVAAAVLTSATAWRLTSSRSATIFAGSLCACSLQILAYANLVLTETPYTLTLIASVYCLVRYHQGEQRRWLVIASLLAGIGYLLRPVALYLVAVLSAAVLLQVWRTQGRRLPRLAVGLGWAMAPAMMVAAPGMVVSQFSQGSLQAARCLDYVFYIRPVTFDGLDSTDSAAMRDIHQVVEEAKRNGSIAPDADFRDRATVIQAYHAVRGLPFAESSKVLGQAGRDIMLEHPWFITLGTLKYAAWMLLTPDPVYRFQPGGAPGRGGKRDTEAPIYDIGTYAFGEGSWEPLLRDYRHYIPLSTESRILTPWWTTLCLWFRTHVENGHSVAGLGDHLFEELLGLCILGGVISLFRRDRAVWLLVASVFSLHVFVSTLFGGSQTRYAAPVKPILWLYLSLLLVTILQALPSAVRILVRRSVGRKLESVQPDAPLGA